MKKKMLFTIIMVLLIIPTVIFAFDSNITDPISNISAPPGEVPTLVNKLLGLLQWVGFGIGVGMLIYIGIKYMMTAANEKAEVKQALINHFIGACVIIAASTIFYWCVDFFTGNGGGGSGGGGGGNPSYSTSAPTSTGGGSWVTAYPTNAPIQSTNPGNSGGGNTNTQTGSNQSSNDSNWNTAYEITDESQLPTVKEKEEEGSSIEDIAGLLFDEEFQEKVEQEKQEPVGTSSPNSNNVN